MNSSFALNRLVAGAAVLCCSGLAAAQDTAPSPYPEYAAGQGAGFPMPVPAQGMSSGAQGKTGPGGTVSSPYDQLPQQMPVPVQIPSYQPSVDAGYGQTPGDYQWQDPGFDQLADGWMQPAGPGYGGAIDGWAQPVNPLHGDEYGYYGQVPYQAIPGQAMPSQSGGFYATDAGGTYGGWQPGAQVVVPSHYYGAPAPEADYHRQMLERLDAIAATLARIESLLQGRK